MAEVEKAPSVRLGEALAVFHRNVEPVIRSVEISASGGLGARAIGEGGIKNAGQFLDNHSSFRKRPRFQIRVHVLLLNIDVMVFGEARLAVVETVGRQRGADENPSPVSGRKFQTAAGVEYGRRIGGLD